MSHAEELGKELAPEGPEQFLQQIDHFLATVDFIVLDGHFMFFCGNEPGFYEGNIGVEFFCEFEVYEQIGIFIQSMFLGL